MKFGRDRITGEELELKPVMVGADLLELFATSEWEVMVPAKIRELASQCPALESESSGTADAAPYFIAKDITPAEVVGWISGYIQ